METSSAPLRWCKSITPASAVSGCLPVGLLLEGCLAALDSVANHTSQKFFLRVQVALHYGETSPSNDTVSCTYSLDILWPRE